MLRLGRNLLTVFLAISLTACANTQRPSIEMWLVDWNAVVATVDAAVASEIGPATCEQVVADLRASVGDLIPTPDPVLDDTVRSWSQLAEGAVFDCQAGGAMSLEEALAELDRLEAEVAAVLEVDRSDTP